MKILFLTEFFPDFKKRIFTGGVEVRTFYTALNLSSKHKVFIICRRQKYQKGEETKGNLTVFRLDTGINDPSANFISIFQRFIFIIHAFFKSLKLDIDMVEGSNFVTFLPAFFIGLFKKIPKIAWYPDVLIGSWQKEFGFLTGLFGEIGERIFLKAPWNKIITISPAVKKKLIKFGVNKNKIEVVFCGVDKKVFKPQKKFKQKTLCVVSRLLPYKRVEDVIKALVLVNKSLNVNLEIVGVGPEKKRSLHLTKELKLTKKVKFYEKLNQKEVAKIISKSHLLIHPSIIEGFGIVLIEAASSGTPFIAANIPTSQMLEKNLKSGLLFEKENEKILADKILKILKDKKLYESLRKNGIENSKKFSWGKLTRKTEQFIIP